MFAVPETIIPHNEKLRLKKLYDYQVLDTHPEDTFDKITFVAMQVLKTPYAFLTFVDEDRVFFKSNISDFQGNIAARENFPCSLAILNDGFSIFYDTHDIDYLKEGYICGEGGVRFYAAAPLKSPEGFLLGTLCVADVKPRTTPLNDVELNILKSLSEVVVNKLESRLRYKKLLRSQNELMSLTLHELKNPLASIKLANEVMKKEPTRLEPMTDMIKESVLRMQDKLHELLKQSETEEELKLNIEETNLEELISGLIKNFELLARRKNQQVKFEFDPATPTIPLDKAKISDVFFNLLSNAIKYSYQDSEIKIIVKMEGSMVCIEFRDQGQGLSSDDIDKLFRKFAKLSAKPTGKETSNGLGLSICKSLVEMHKGKIFAESPGKDQGSSFFVLLPLHSKNEDNSKINTL
ncbi:GAF domain-containing sensor histidine kinase [Flavobacterium sp. D11R37]|uniref:GAF domain-containing sensor histidine kinase n=1 Tax=Flavobacterium coralii TaxID=2838017 RepID=UPI001CA7892B|nr:GAF domain-containing sensor histidine kinase [Flavobacterium coralii]MBY8961400.1 GAF domain-containing sensor histidine kinase [Flavobacterium coralii]